MRLRRLVDVHANAPGVVELFDGLGAENFDECCGHAGGHAVVAAAHEYERAVGDPLAQTICVFGERVLDVAPVVGIA